MSRSSVFRVFAGNTVGLVMIAFFRSAGHGQVRGGPTAGISRRSTSLAVTTFFSRLAITASTVTASCVSCHTS